jgi:hypothetical protein
MERFRGGLVFEAHSFLYNSTLGSRVIKKNTGWELTDGPWSQSSAVETSQGRLHASYVVEIRTHPRSCEWEKPNDPLESWGTPNDPLEFQRVIWLFPLAIARVSKMKATMELFCMERGLNQKLSGNVVYYTNFLILLVKNMLCSQLHCQKILI